jgi:hypothetical protein
MIFGINDVVTTKQEAVQALYDYIGDSDDSVEQTPSAASAAETQAAAAAAEVRRAPLGTYSKFYITYFFRVPDWPPGSLVFCL